MRHIKLFKLANFIEKYSSHEANLIRKMASEGSFPSMILGSYTVFNANQYESKALRQRVISEINDSSPKYNYASVQRLAQVINGNEAVKNSVEDHADFWKQKPDNNLAITGLNPSQIVEFKKALLSTAIPESASKPREERDEQSRRYQAYDITMLVNGIAKYQRLMRDIGMAFRALSEAKSVLIPRTSGAETPGYLAQYNPKTKEGLFVFDPSIENGQKRMILDQTIPSSLDFLSLNNDRSYISSIKAAELNGLFLIPPMPKINVPRSSGGISEGEIRGYEYVSGMGRSVTVYFENGTLNKTFSEADGGLFSFIDANPDLLKMGNYS